MQPRPQLTPETILKIQIFRKNMEDAASLIGNDPSQEAVFARMKLNEAVFWAIEGLSRQLSPQVAAPQPAGDASSTPAPQAPASNEEQPAPAAATNETAA